MGFSHEKKVNAIKDVINNIFFMVFLLKIKFIYKNNKIFYKPYLITLIKQLKISFILSIFAFV